MEWRGLIAEKNEQGVFEFSLGRIAFWIVFLFALYKWVAMGDATSLQMIDIHASHMQMLYITASYNILKKATWFKTETSKTGASTVEYSNPGASAPVVTDEGPPPRLP